MGLFGEIRRQFIARPDDVKHTLFFKWPERTLRKFSQLTVDPGDVVVLIAQGRAHAKFVPGRYTLDADEYTVLRNLVDQGHVKGENAFACELYFVSTVEHGGFFFTGSLGAPANDNDHEMHALTVGGEYSLLVTNAEAFFELLITQRIIRNRDLSQWLSDTIMDDLKVSFAASLKGQALTPQYFDEHRTALEHDVVHRANARLASVGLKIQVMHHFSLMDRSVDDAPERLFARLGSTPDAEIINDTDTIVTTFANYALHTTGLAFAHQTDAGALSSLAQNTAQEQPSLQEQRPV